MKLIYMQSSIDYLHSIDPQLLVALSFLGTPEVIEMNNGTKYYKYEDPTSR